MKKVKILFPILFILTCFSGDIYINHITANDQEIRLNTDEGLELPEVLTFESYEDTPETLGSRYGIKFRDLIKENIDDFWSEVKNNGFTREEVMNIVKQQERNLTPQNIEEILSMSKISFISYDDLLAFNLFTIPDPNNDDGCTSWIATGTATESGDTILHKNRDLTIEPQVIVRIKRDGKNEYIATITAGQTLSAPSGINEHGLVVFNDWVTHNPINYNPIGIDATVVDRMILEECNSVDEVAPYLDTIFIQGGTMFFLGDKDKGAIIEATGWERKVIMVENDINYRSNHFIELSDDLTYECPEPGTSSTRRYNAAKEFLESKKGTLTALDCNNLSRHHYYSTEKAINEFDSPDGSICNYHTLSGSTFQIDQDYPGVLSVFWSSAGHPDSSLYTPIHYGSTQIHSTWYENESAWDLAQTISDNNLGPRHGLTPYFLDIEEQMMIERNDTRTYAYNFLEASQTTEAKANLTAFDLNKGSYISNQIRRLASKTFWIDSFYEDNALKSLIDLGVNSGNISLSTGKLSGIVKSINIDTIASGWKDAQFYTNHSIPIGSNITYKILDASNNNILYSITTDSSEVDYDMSNIAASSIILSAEFETNNTLNSPVLEEWGIIGLDAIPSEESWLGVYEITIMVSIGCFIGVCLAIVIRRKQYINKTNKTRDKVSPETIKKGESQVNYAKTKTRVLAWLIDMVIVCALLFLVYLICLIPIFFNPLSIRIGFYPTLMIGLSAIFLTGVFYFFIVETVNKGQTVGKKLLKIRSVDEKTLEKSTAGKYAINSLAQGSPLILFDVMIGLLKNVGKPKKKFRITQDLSKIIVIQAKRN